MLCRYCAVNRSYSFRVLAVQIENRTLFMYECPPLETFFFGESLHCNESEKCGIIMKELPAQSNREQVKGKKQRVKSNNQRAKNNEQREESNK